MKAKIQTLKVSQKKGREKNIINHNFTAIYLVTMNCTCPMLEELTKMIADEIKLGDRDVFAYK